MSILEVLTKKRQFRLPNLHQLVHQGDHWAHRCYLCLVSIEVKYWYGKAALVILVFEILSIFVHEEIE